MFLDDVAVTFGLSLPNIIIIVFLFGGLIFYGKDIKLGAILHFLIFAGLYVWFDSVGYNTFLVIRLLILMFIVLIFILILENKE